MSAPTVFSRRNFLRSAGAFSALSLAASLDRLGLASAAAQTPGYKALVCVFLFGGNDANHMVIPYTDYASYAAVRDAASGIQVLQAELLQIAPTNTPGKVFGLHPAFAATGANPNLPSIFNAGKLAVVANVGTLVEPINRAAYMAGTKKRPDNLFSHSDQQQQGMTAITTGTGLVVPTGWGGRLADRLVGLNAPDATAMAMSFSGAQTFGNGATVRSLSLPTSGQFGYSGDPSGAATGSALARINARTGLIQATDANDMVAAAQSMMNTALTASQKLNPIIQGAGSTSVTTPFTGLTSGLANQLKAVARVIEQRATLGHAREVFFVSIGGFDTHTGQGAGGTAAGLGGLYTQVSQALAAFYQATVNLGVADSVTTFTVSDFARTFKPNGSGTDHAWGTHAFVLGGAVVGQKLYGTYPTLALSGPDDTDSSGRWIPTTAVDQYGATLGRWFGVSDADLATVFPNLSRFPTANLGFLG